MGEPESYPSSVEVAQQDEWIDTATAPSAPLTEPPRPPNVSEPPLERVPPSTIAWLADPTSYDRIRRVIEEWEWYKDQCHMEDHTPRGAPETTDCAQDFKAYLLRFWPKLPRATARATKELSKRSAFWNRIALQRLRFNGERHYYLVAHTFDRGRRLMVLKVPPQQFSSTKERFTHAQRQATYNDDTYGRYAPGVTLNPDYLRFLQPNEEHLRQGFLYGYPILRSGPLPRFQGKNYKSCVELKDRAGADLDRQAALGKLEGPLHYAPDNVCALGSIYFPPPKDKFRNVWDFTASGLNPQTIVPNTRFDLLQDVLIQQRPDCWQSGFDMKDAFWNWARNQLDCEYMGVRHPVTGEYYRARFAIFGGSDCPWIQAENAQVIKRILNTEGLKHCTSPRTRDYSTFKCTGIFVDDGHCIHDSSLTREEANEQTRSYTRTLTEYFGISEKKTQWPEKVKDYVGVDIDATRQIVSIRPERRKKYIAAIDEMLEHLERQPASGVSLLDLCGGIGTAAHALVANGTALRKHMLVDIDPQATAMAQHYSSLLHSRFSAHYAKDALDLTLPQDVCALTEEHVLRMGPVDLVMAAWPCQGLSKANTRGQGLRDGRSGLFWECLRVLRLVRKHNPHVQFLFENVDFSDRPHLQEEYRQVSAALNVQPFTFDAAWVSAAHRIRSYWCSWDITEDPRNAPRTTLDSVLDVDHIPMSSTYTDSSQHGRAPLNRKGQPQAVFTTITRTEDTYSQRRGEAYVWDVDFCTLVTPRIEEIERMLGLLSGATAAPNATRAARRAACGNVIDRRALSWLFAQGTLGRSTDAQGHSLVQRTALASLVGKLQFCAELVPGGQSLLTHCYRARDAFSATEFATRSVRGQWRKDVTVTSSHELLRELRTWRRILRRGSSRRYYLEPRPRESGFWKGVVEDSDAYMDEHWATSSGIPAFRIDAAGTSGGSAYLHHRHIHQFPEKQSKPHESSNFRELYMFLVALRQYGHLWKGQRVLGRCDNTTAVSVINRQGTHAPRLHKLAKRIIALARKLDVEIAATHIKGELNVLADRLSRYVRSFDSTDWMYDPALFAAIDELVGPHTVDAQSDPVGHNSQCARYWSVVDSCYDHSFTHESVWANSDFKQLEAILEKFRDDFRHSPYDTSLTLLVPCWGHRKFWRKLKGGKVVAYHPQGSHVFTSPHWERLRRGRNVFSMGAHRTSRGPTAWDVAVVHFPCAWDPRCGQDATPHSQTGESYAERRRRLDAMPTLSGRPEYDMHLLSQLSAPPLPPVQPRGGGA